MLTAEKPSTSLSTAMRVNTALSLTWLGSGSCTRMPCTSSLALSASTCSKICSCVAVSGNSMSTDRNPTSPATFFFIFTYVCESLRVPTSTTASPGLMPWFSDSARASAAISRCSAAAIALPSIISHDEGAALSCCPIGGAAASRASLLEDVVARLKLCASRSLKPKTRGLPTLERTRSLTLVSALRHQRLARCLTLSATNQSATEVIACPPSRLRSARARPSSSALQWTPDSRPVEALRTHVHI